MTNSLSGLRSFFRPWARDLVHVASVAGVLPRVTSTLRSSTYQAKLYRDYLAGRNAYPVAPPGSSAHELGLAFDMVTSPMSALSDLGAVWEDWGGVWGGRFGDEVHFEFPGAAQHAVAKHQANVAKAVVDKVNSLPWYVQAVLPQAASVQTTEQHVQVTKGYVERFLESLGLLP